jgi:hypothetical protein
VTAGVFPLGVALGACYSAKLAMVGVLLYLLLR